MSEFKVGDKVRVITSALDDEYHIFSNKEGVVAIVWNDMPYPYDVCFESNQGAPFLPDELELIVD